MRIENTADEVIIALPKNIISRDEIQRLLNYFRYKELVAKSQATETQITELTSEIKKGVAERSAKSRQHKNRY